MRNAAWLVLLLGLLSMRASAPARAAQLFSKVDRQRYIAEAISAFRSAPRDGAENLRKFLLLVDQNKCRSAFETLTVRCLQDEMDRNCAAGALRSRPRCEVVADILVVNKLNEKQFVSAEEKFKMSQSAKSYTSAYNSVLEKKYALLTTEFLLFSKEDCADADTTCLARELDQYCLHHADVMNLPWQACVSAVVWSIGTSR